jgi:hypothetical protein
MRVLIVSEGRHELRTDEFPGALEILVKRIAGDFTVVKMKVSVELPRLRASGRGYYKRALQWMDFAQKNDYDAIILVIDQDEDPDRRLEISQAQDDTKYSIQRAMTVAIRSFDAWMLADETAISKVLGRTIQQQPSPESNPDPKASCEELCGQKMAQAEMYAKIAAALKLKVLASRCPKGFKPFADRIGRLTIRA